MDMADQEVAREEAPLLGSAARAVGKVVLVGYWIACLGVIAFGLSQMEWRRPPPPRPAVATHPVASVRTVSPRPTSPPKLQPTPVRTAQPTRPRPAESIAPAPPSVDVGLVWWALALALISLGGIVLLVLHRRRRRGHHGRFSGRRHPLGSMR